MRHQPASCGVRSPRRRRSRVPPLCWLPSSNWGSGFEAGISSGIGGLAYAGIPLTHRAKSRVVTFLTGHNATTVTSTSVDWQAVSEGSQVLVFYMSLRNIAEITKLLMEAGRSREEPVAFVSRATLPDQQVVVSTLQNAARDSKEILTPALVVVGETVNFCKELDWLQI